MAPLQEPNQWAGGAPVGGAPLDPVGQQLALVWVRRPSRHGRLL
ncbi:hypothetical protein QFZ56_001202 [Streptomyces achromogenes]|uniref:Uncharacterized protein n=1 Tax=Streptomyces achromogenes TaxID=67255 RepID=A0ABU0PV21_STRAH|nr:hypothetical protein [Streptomyces achromogenes]